MDGNVIGAALLDASVSEGAEGFALAPFFFAMLNK